MNISRHSYNWHGDGFVALDCIGCHNGFFFGIETKAPGKHPTPRQRMTMEDMEAANGRVFIIGETYANDKYSGMGELEAWLLMLKD